MGYQPKVALDQDGAGFDVALLQPAKVFGLFFLAERLREGTRVRDVPGHDRHAPDHGFC